MVLRGTAWLCGLFGYQTRRRLTNYAALNLSAAKCVSVQKICSMSLSPNTLVDQQRKWRRRWETRSKGYSQDREGCWTGITRFLSSELAPAADVLDGCPQIIAPMQSMRKLERNWACIWWRMGSGEPTISTIYIRSYQFSGIQFTHNMYIVCMNYDISLNQVRL